MNCCGCGTTTCSEDQSTEILSTLAGSATALGVAAINASKPSPAPISAPSPYVIPGTGMPLNTVLIVAVIVGLFLVFDKK